MVLEKEFLKMVIISKENLKKERKIKEYLFLMKIEDYLKQLGNLKEKMNLLEEVNTIYLMELNKLE
jgi:hypothetical protein